MRSSRSTNSPSSKVALVLDEQLVLGFVDKPANPVAAQTGTPDQMTVRARREAFAGALAVGSTFAWSTAGLDIVSVIDAVEAPNRIGWHGETNGILGIHVWTFSSSEAGTLVTTEESWEGPALPSNVGALQQALDTSLTRWLSSLKAHVER
jgi:hypothetical protein